MTQRDKRPDRWYDERLSCDPVDHGVAAIPAAAWTHAVVKHGSRELAAPARFRRELVAGSLVQTDEGKGSWLDPAAGSGSPAPAAVRPVYWV